MARRIATEYKQLELNLSCQQLQEFMRMFKKSDFRTEVRVFENGDTEFILFDEGDEIPISFLNMGNKYYFEGSYIIKNWSLAHVMQKAVREFKGDALVHRIYENQVIAYHYVNGSVSLIKEIKGQKERVVYEIKDINIKLQQILNDKVVEDQIEWVKLQIDQLLDRRLTNKESIDTIDNELKTLSHQLFYLEA